MLALLANAVIKTAIAFYAGAPSYSRNIATGFAAMLVTGFALWLI